MMKKLTLSLVVIILSLVVITMLSGIGYAQEEKGILNELPGVKQGMAWDFASDSVMSLTSVDVAVYKEKLALGIGALTDLEVAIPALTLNYKIGNLENLGFNYPLQGSIIKIKL